MKSPSDAQVDCRACSAGLPIVWHVQSKKYMHLTAGLSVTSCAVIDEAREQRARAIGNDSGNEDQRGR